MTQTTPTKEQIAEIAAFLCDSGFDEYGEQIEALKSTPPAPVTPLTESEVMPDTSGSRSNSGDTATPQASMLAPGADALIDRNALIDLLAKIEDGPYLGAEGVADAVIELLLQNLTRAQGGKP